MTEEMSWPACLLPSSPPVGGIAHLPGIQVVCHLEHQEEDAKRLLLDGVPLPVLDNLSTEGQQRVDFLQLAFHQQQLGRRGTGTRIPFWCTRPSACHPLGDCRLHVGRPQS